MEYIKEARVSGNKSGLYIDPRTASAYIDIRHSLNYNDIDFTGVNNICIHRYDNGSFYIFAVGGYTPESGLFTRNYKYIGG